MEAYGLVIDFASKTIDVSNQPWIPQQKPLPQQITTFKANC